MRGAVRHLRHVSQWVLSAALAGVGALAVAVPLLSGLLRLLLDASVRWSKDLFWQWLWASVPRWAPELAEATLKLAQSNTTALGPGPAPEPVLMVAMDHADLGSAWTWACFALAAWRRIRVR